MAGFYSGTIQKGSSGDDVKRWQEFLNTHGYGLSVDGDFGDNTYNATIDWQTNNGLSADGIVGQNTWGKAGFSNINTPVSAPTLGAAPTKPTYNTTPWLDTDEGKTANQRREDADSAVNNYGDFSYSKQDTFEEIMNKILNREKFSYDLNGDALYQQYKDKYIQQGKMAMQDTMGQAAAMTGGYGNSYAASVGNQAYQAQLNNLNDVIPELYQMAYDKYNQEGQDLYNQYGLLSDDRNMEYGLWGDKYNRLLADREYANSNFYNGANLYGSELDRANSAAQQNYQNEFNAWTENNDNAQWEANFNEAIRQSELSQRTAAEKAAIVASSGGKLTVDDKGNIVQNPDGGTEDDITSTVPQKYVDALKGYKTNTQKANYLAGLVNDGVISQEAAQALLSEHRNDQDDFQNRTWTMESDGGMNWFWGVDNNAKVKDQYGNIYRLDDLVDKLVGEGMTKKQAKDYVKNLQKQLGI